ncbi:hypothetical protein TNCV_2767391 [Trichonephila clavipes]|nr:hypothetical protein TNCV_2767391 [Trichonephila clavipes]
MGLLYSGPGPRPWRQPRLILDINKIMIQMIFMVECYFRTYSTKKREYSNNTPIGNDGKTALLCDDCHPCLGLGLPLYTIIIHFVERWQSVCAYVFVSQAHLFVTDYHMFQVFDNVCYVLSTFKGHRWALLLHGAQSLKKS